MKTTQPSYEKVTHKIPEGVRFEFNNFMSKPWEFDGLLLHQVGELCCNAAYEIPVHMQWCHEISYIVSGSASFFCNDQEYPVEPGDLFTSPKGVQHSILANQKEPLRLLYLGFDFSIVLDKYTELQHFFQNEKAGKIGSAQKIINPFYLLIDQFFCCKPGAELLIYSTLLQLLTLTYQGFKMLENRNYKSTLSDKAVGQMVYEAILFVNRNLFTITGVGALAGELGYNPCYLSHIFHEKMGQTLQQYISHKKILKSIELFSLGNYLVTDIAKQLNYASIQSFSKAFRRETGFSPTQYIQKFCSL